jgi:hypothetical protein
VGRLRALRTRAAVRAPSPSAAPGAADKNLLRWLKVVNRLLEIISRITPGDWEKVKSGWLA